MFVLVNGRSVASTAAERMVAVDARMTRLAGQIAKGERFTEPAEDPAGNLRAAALARLDARLVAEQRAIDRASGRFALAESAVKGATAVLERARELAILGASDSFGEADRQVFAAELRGLKEQLLGLANMRDEGGRYLFAGARDGLPAFAQDPAGAVLFEGFANGPGAEAAGIARLSLPTGGELFGPDADGTFASLDRMIAALEEPDPIVRREELDAALDGIVAGHDRLMVNHARMGTAMNRLETETERVAAGRLEAARGLAAVKGLDLTAAISELEALRLTLSASQQLFQRVYGSSLFDRLG